MTKPYPTLAFELWHDLPPERQMDDAELTAALTATLGHYGRRRRFPTFGSRCCAAASGDTALALKIRTQGKRAKRFRCRSKAVTVKGSGWSRDEGLCRRHANRATASQRERARVLLRQESRQLEEARPHA